MRSIPEPDQVEIHLEPGLGNFASLHRETQIRKFLGFVRKHAIRILVVSASTGAMMITLDKCGMEVSFPVFCKSLTCTCAGTEALLRAARMVKKNGDQRALAIIRREP